MRSEASAAQHEQAATDASVSATNRHGLPPAIASQLPSQVLLTSVPQSPSGYFDETLHRPALDVDLATLLPLLVQVRASHADDLAPMPAQ